MGRLNVATIRSISNMTKGKLVVIYGKSNTGKTTLGATFPKPLLYVKIGDDGVNSIIDIPDIDVLETENLDDLLKTTKDITKNKKYAKYKTVMYDTFSFIVELWKAEHLKDKTTRMTQPMWGDLMVFTNSFINEFAKQAQDKWVIVTGHEVMDTIDGFEDELLPDGRISINKGSRNHLEGLANLGLHTVRVKKETQTDDGRIKVNIKFGVDIGPNAYYWTKVQTVKSNKVQGRIINPTYDKIMEVLK